MFKKKLRKNFVQKKVVSAWRLPNVEILAVVSEQKKNKNEKKRKEKNSCESERIKRLFFLDVVKINNRKKKKKFLDVIKGHKNIFFSSRLERISTSLKL